jgi:hypothetical protein
MDELDQQVKVTDPARIKGKVRTQRKPITQTVQTTIQGCDHGVGHSSLHCEGQLLQLAVFRPLRLTQEPLFSNIAICLV